MENNIQFLYDILLSDTPSETVHRNLDELLNIIPELKNEIGLRHNDSYHHLDVWNHTLFALSMSKKDFDVRLTLLLHDIGKPYSFSEENDHGTFEEHAKKSKEMSKDILSRLGFSNSYQERIGYLIEKHEESIKDEDIKTKPELALKLYEVQKSNILAQKPGVYEKNKRHFEKIKKRIDKSLKK